MKIIIDDFENNIENFDLRNILALISDGEKYKWYLREMFFDSIIRVLSENQLTKINMINDCEGNYNILWRELTEIVNYEIKTFKGTIIGYFDTNDKIEISRLNSNWTIITNNTTIIENIKNTVKSIKIEN